MKNLQSLDLNACIPTHVLTSNEMVTTQQLLQSGLTTYSYSQHLISSCGKQNQIYTPNGK